jgi:hypothetical protein
MAAYGTGRKNQEAIAQLPVLWEEIEKKQT